MSWYDRLAKLAQLLDADGNPPGGAPTGAAGGQLTGTYPNPSVASSHSGSTHAAVLTNVRRWRKITPMNTTGRELRTLRTLSGVTVNALVEAIGLSRTTVWAIERQPIVKPETAARYRDAIARLMQKAA